MRDEQHEGQEGTEEQKGQKGSAEKCPQCAEYLAIAKRALADYDNLKKENEKMKLESSKWAKVNLAYDLIPVMDNFDLAVEFAPQDPDNTNGFLKGVRNIRAQLASVVHSIGMESYGIQGEIFDPTIHESVGETSDDKRKDQEVIEVKQFGWKVGDKVVRPAKVIINNLSSTSST